MDGNDVYAIVSSLSEDYEFGPMTTNMVDVEPGYRCLIATGGVLSDTWLVAAHA